MRLTSTRSPRSPTAGSVLGEHQGQAEQLVHARRVTRHCHRGALAVAVAYSKATVAEAKRANDIALHSEKLATYKGILSIQTLLRAHGPHFPEYDFWSKYEYVELTEFYFSKALGARVHEYFKLGREARASRDLWDDAHARGDDARKEAVAKTWALFNKCVELGDVLVEDMKKELRLHPAK